MHRSHQRWEKCQEHFSTAVVHKIAIERVGDARRVFAGANMGLKTLVDLVEDPFGPQMEFQIRPGMNCIEKDDSHCFAAIVSR